MGHPQVHEGLRRHRTVQVCAQTWVALRVMQNISLDSRLDARGAGPHTSDPFNQQRALEPRNSPCADARRLTAFDGQRPDGAGTHLGPEELIVVATAGLGAVHGRIGVHK